MPSLIRRQRNAALVIAAVLITLASAIAAHVERSAPTHGETMTWTEVAWALPLDNWGQGQAWRATDQQGVEVLLFARTKTGFCNCFNGIADDVEIDRIGDVDLHGDSFIPAGPGEPESVGALHGRKRLFQTSGTGSGARYVLSVVTASDCKALVATLVSDRAISSAAEASAVAMMTGTAFRRWVENQ